MATIELRRRTWTVGEYRRMVEVGVLSKDDRVELIEGEIVEMSPIGDPHAACVDRLNEVLVLAVRGRATVRVQGPVQLPPSSVPQPDLALLVPRPDFYASETPGPADTVLVIEVADSSVAFDRRVKLPLYARSGIAEAWLIDLPASTIEVHREAGAQGYGSVTAHRAGEVVTPAALPDITLDVTWLLGT